MRRPLVVLLGLLAGALLLANVGRSVSGIRLQQLPRSRFWDDVTIAIAQFQGEDFRVEEGDDDPRRGVLESYEVFVLRTDRAERLGREIRRDLEEGGRSLKAWEFWKTVPFRLKPSLRHLGRPIPSALEDHGRAAILGSAFGVLGGVAPFLLLWLAPLLAVPLLVWCGLQLSEAGLTLAGIVFPFLVASSAFSLGTLFMTHSAEGFYLLGLILLVPFSVLFASVKDIRALALASGIGGLLFAVCVLCRSGALLEIPAFLLALGLAARAVLRGSALRGLSTAIGLWALFLLPSWLAAPQGRHSTWIGVWEGLGDFDREKGYAWDGDRARQAVLGAQGEVVRRISLCPPFSGGGYELDIFSTPSGHRALERALLDQEGSYEALARDLVLRDIRSDPGWFLKILGKRVYWTLTQRKLWPFGPRDGRSMEPASAPGEGSMDHYYHYTPEADMLFWRGGSFEVPISAVLLPTLVLVLLGIASPWVPPMVQERVRVGLSAVGILAIGALALPVLVTTAGAQETEAFVLVHFLALAVLVDVAAGAARGFRAPAAERPKASLP
jgi:hypothetical protein